MATNKLTEVAGLVAQAVMGAKVKDKDGNTKTVKPTGDDNLLDLTDIVAGGSTGGNTGGNAGGGTTGGNSGGTTGGGTDNPASQLPSTVNLFSGSAVGNILLSGPTPNYDNVQDGLLITLSNQTANILSSPYGQVHIDLSSIGLKPIKIPKEKLIVNNSFDISDQLSQYISKSGIVQNYHVDGRNDFPFSYSFSIASFEGTAIKVLPNTTLSMNLIMHVKGIDNNSFDKSAFPIPVIKVNTYKN